MAINATKVSAGEALDVLRSAWRAQSSGQMLASWMLHGRPGVGKTELIQQLADEIGAELFDLRLTTIEPQDLRGLPFYDHDTGKTVWYRPEDLPDTDRPAILFLDELTAAAPTLQPTVYGVLQERRVGRHKLPDSVFIVAAGNMVEDGAVAYEMGTALSDRLVHMIVQANAEDWIKSYAPKAGIHPSVVAFLQTRPDLLETTEAALRRGEAIACTPRAWSRVSAIMEIDLPKATRQVMVAGTVGEAPAAEFSLVADELGAVLNLEDMIETPRGQRAELYPQTLHGLTALVYGLPRAVTQDRVAAGIEILADMRGLDRPGLPVSELAAFGFELLIARAMDEGWQAAFAQSQVYADYAKTREASGFGVRASKPLAHLAEVDPALSILALWCRHEDGIGQTQTTGNTIRYGPSFTDLTLAEQIGTVAHHVLHVALQHSERFTAVQERQGAAFTPDLFGLAADGIVNETLLQAGHGLPRPAVLLTELLKSIGEPAKGPVAALADWDCERLAMYLHADAKRAGRAEDYAKRKSFTNDVQPQQGDPSQDSRSPAEWRQHMVRALEAGRRAGVGIGRLGAILADLAPPQVPWEIRLRAALAKAVMQEPTPSHRRPAGRWAAMLEDATRRNRPVPAFQPGRTRDRLRPRIAVGLDTSSSIDDGILKRFLSETQGVGRRTGAETHLLAFDEDVHVNTMINAWSGGLEGIALRTGGGTDFRPMFEHARAVDPSILVVLTDLDGPIGPTPTFPVLWAVPGAVEAKPPFGTLLRLDA